MLQNLLSRNYLVLAIVSLITISCSLSVRAHEIQPAIIDLSFEGSNSAQLSIETNLEALIAGIGPEHQDTDDAPESVAYDGLRALSPEELNAKFSEFQERFFEGLSIVAGVERVDAELAGLTIPEVGDVRTARRSIIELSVYLPEGAQTLAFKWDEIFGTAVIRAPLADTEEERYTAFLEAGEASEPIPLAGAQARDVLTVIVDYIGVGFTHIVPKGLDHILFVIGIFLASLKLGSIVWQVSAFTLAHTATLALGSLGLVQISPSIVEPLIALSIAYVCLENILFKDMTKWRPAVIFGFGLLHGLGFAGVLGEFGLPQSEFIVGLISFNIGVEIGQLFVIAVCFALVGYWFGKKPYYRQFIVIPASLVIGAIGVFWFFERILAG